MKVRLPEMSQIITSMFWVLIPIIAFTITYLHDRPIYKDEAALALNIIERDWRDLWSELDHNQGAPIGFLLASKAITSLAGHSTLALRSISYMSSIVTCFLLYTVGKQTVPRAIPILMIWLGTVEGFLYYGTEFKQYSSDLMFGLMITLCAFLILKDWQRRYIISWAIVGSIAVWFSHPAAFVIAGTGLTLIAIVAQGRDWQHMRDIVIASGGTLISFGIVFMISYRLLLSGTDVATFMYDFWDSHFFKLTPEWIVKFPFILLLHSVGYSGSPILAILILFGLVIGLRQLPRSQSLLLIIPVFVTVCASWLEMYPAVERTLFFLLPAIMILCLAGWLEVWQTIHANSKTAAQVVLIIVVGLFLYDTEFVTYDYDYLAIDATVARVTPEAEIYLTDTGWLYTVPRYYRTAYQLITPEQSLDSIRADHPNWVFVEYYVRAYYTIGDELNIQPPHLQIEDNLAYCVDGYVTPCPELSEIKWE